MTFDAARQPSRRDRRRPGSAVDIALRPRRRGRPYRRARRWSPASPRSTSAVAAIDLGRAAPAWAPCRAQPHCRARCSTVAPMTQPTNRDRRARAEWCARVGGAGATRADRGDGRLSPAAAAGGAIGSSSGPGRRAPRLHRGRAGRRRRETRTCRAATGAVYISDTGPGEVRASLVDGIATRDDRSSSGAVPNSRAGGRSAGALPLRRAAGHYRIAVDADPLTTFPSAALRCLDAGGDPMGRSPPDTDGDIGELGCRAARTRCRMPALPVEPDARSQRSRLPTDRLKASSWSPRPPTASELDRRHRLVRGARRQSRARRGHGSKAAWRS